MHLRGATALGSAFRSLPLAIGVKAIVVATTRFLALHHRRVCGKGNAVHGAV